MAKPDLVLSLGQWIQEPGPSSDVAVTSRVRLARNVSGHAFPQWAVPAQLSEVGRLVDGALKESRLTRFSLRPLEEFDLLDRQLLVEEHLISPAFSQLEEGRFVVLSPAEHVSVMVNEEDHLRIQTLKSGFRIKEAWERADEVDDALGEGIQYAFSEKWGYLTTCPTNAGTGMRASVMLHLPALVMTDQLAHYISALQQLGVVVRGLFGEGTHSAGNFYQVSNNTTLGRSEEETLDHLTNVAKQVIDRERTARKILYADSRDKLVDRAYRALGILRHARLMSFPEAIELLSMVRLGTDLGLVKDVDVTLLNELTLLIRPAHLEVAAAERAVADDREEAVRSQIIRATLDLHLRGGEQSV